MPPITPINPNSVATTTTNISPTGWGLDEGNNVGLRSVVMGDGSANDGTHKLAILNSTVSIYQDIETVAGRIFRLTLRAGHVGTGSKLRLVWGPYSTLLDLTSTLSTYTFDLPAAESSTRLRFFATQGTSGTQVELDALNLVLLSDTARCNFSVSPSPLDFDGLGSPVSVTVTNTSGTNCVWGIESLPDWIAFPAAGKRHGTSTIVLDPAQLSILVGDRNGFAGGHRVQDELLPDAARGTPPDAAHAGGRLAGEHVDVTRRVHAEPAEIALLRRDAAVVRCLNLPSCSGCMLVLGTDAEPFGEEAASP